MPRMAGGAEARTERPSDFDPRDFYAGMEEEDPGLYPQEPWDDDYTDYDPVDMYAAEWRTWGLGR